MKQVANTQTQRSARVLSAIAGTLVATLAACDSGSSSSSSGGGPNPGGAPLLADFALRKDLHLGTVQAQVADIHHVDLDGDGLEDLVEADFDTQVVVVAYGEADGTFTPTLELATAGRTWMVTTGDMNGDSILDIAAISQTNGGAGQSVVEVFLQDAVGQFGGAITAVTVSNPTGLTTAPLSGIDGGVGPDEIFVCLRDVQLVARFSLDGANNLIQFATLDSASLGSAGAPFTVAAVDLGNDGLLDIVVAEEYVLSGGPGRLVAYARSTGTDFQSAIEVMSGLARPIVESVGDVDANGFDDVSVAQLGADTAFLLAADGSGLSTSVPIDFAGRTTSLIFPDLNGDGLAEVVGTVFFQSTVQVRTATGPLVWGDPVHYNVGLAPRAIGVLELPGDATPDLLCSNVQDISVIANVGNDPVDNSPVLRCAKGYSTGIANDGPTIIDSADLDNNGTVDVVTVTNRQQAITFMEGMGDGSFEIATILPLMPTPDDEQGYIAIADMDMNGTLDVLTSVKITGEVLLYRNNGSIDGFTDPPPQDITAVGSEPLGIDVADVNDDMMPDVVVANSGDNTIQVLLNVGGGEFVAQPPMALPFKPKGPVCMDLDNNGTIDCAVASEDDGTGQYQVAILAGDGSAGFTVSEIHDLDGPTNNLAMGDFTGDGLLEIVAGQSEVFGDELFILFNQGGLSFDSQRLQVSPGPGTVIVADVDNDQILDIIVPTTPGELKLALGDGNGNFTIEPLERGDLPVPRSTITAEYADTDGDFLPDLLFGSRRAPFLWVGKNTSVPAP